MARSSPGSACRTPRSFRSSSSATAPIARPPSCSRAQKEQLAAARPDVIVMFDTDHLNTFFLDNLPIFAVGVDKTFTGAERRAARDADLHDPVGGRSRRRISAKTCIEAGFDAALTQHFLGRPFDRGAAALPDAGHERSR